MRFYISNSILFTILFMGPAFAGADLSDPVAPAPEIFVPVIEQPIPLAPTIKEPALHAPVFEEATREPVSLTSGWRDRDKADPGDREGRNQPSRDRPDRDPPDPGPDPAAGMGGMAPGID